MAFPVISRVGIRYLGNKDPDHLEVHDLENEDERPHACQIDEIIDAGNAVGFTPDTLAQAHSEGFDDCHYCLSGSTR